MVAGKGCAKNGNPEAKKRGHRLNSMALQGCVRFTKSLKRKDVTNQSRPFSMRGPEVFGSTYFRRAGEETGTRYRRSKRLSARRRSWRCGAGPVAGLAEMANIWLRNSREVETCLQETCRLLH